MIENNPQRIQRHIDDHFKELLGRIEDHIIALDPNIWEAVDNLDGLNKETREDAQDKTPGLDEFPMFFYRSYWEIIKEDFMSLVDEMNKGTERWDRLNYTQIVPKTSNPIKITDFRMISLMNCSIKTISKVLTNRLAPKLHELADQY